jgi:putative tricarboxylic transport membrane protein
VSALLYDVIMALSLGLLGSVLFSAIGLISGTDETTTIAPVTLLVVLLGAPPVAVFTFWMCSAISKHMIHAVPTALLGIPGDTLALPLMQQANVLRNLGAPHIALRKMLAGGVISAFIAVPCSVLFAIILAPFGTYVTTAAPWVFIIATLFIAYLSAGRWASIIALIPFTLLIVALQALTQDHGIRLGVSYFLGIAIGPLVAELLSVMSPLERARMDREIPRETFVAPDVRSWDGYFPNPFRVLDRGQVIATAIAAVVSSAAFVFSPVAITVIAGEVVGSRVKQAYHRLTTILAVRNGVTESTYISGAIIPLIAFGLPLSPVAAGPAAPLFSAPPRFSVDPVTGSVTNLHTLMSASEFLVWGLVSVLIASLIAYPLAMNHARVAANFVSRHVSHEAIIATFVGLVLVIGLWDGGVIAVLVIGTVGLVGGLLYRVLGVNPGVQFMGYYVAILSVPTLLKLIG